LPLVSPSFSKIILGLPFAFPNSQSFFCLLHLAFFFRVALGFEIL